MNDIAEVVMKYVLAPVVSAITGFMVWLYKKQQIKIDALEQRVMQIEKSNAVLEVKLDVMKDDIREIKEGIHQLIERQWKK